MVVTLPVWLLVVSRVGTLGSVGGFLPCSSFILVPFGGAGYGWSVLAVAVVIALGYAVLLGPFLPTILMPWLCPMMDGW